MGNSARVVKATMGTMANTTEICEVTSGTGLKVVTKTSEKAEGWVDTQFERMAKNSALEAELQDLDLEEEILDKKQSKLEKELKLLETQSQIDKLKSE